MSTLVEIEAAVDALPSREHEALFRHLEQRLKKRSAPKWLLPLVPATGRPITQEEMDGVPSTRTEALLDAHTVRKATQPR